MSKVNKNNLLLLVPVLGYAVINVVLVITSLVFYVKLQHAAMTKADDEDAAILEETSTVQCNPLIFPVWSFLSASAAISSLTAGVISLTLLRFIKGDSIDPRFVFRGIIFSLVVTLSVVFLGWMIPACQVIKQKPLSIDVSIEGQFGVFSSAVAQLIPGRSLTLFVHWVLILGATIAAITIPMSTPTGFLAVDPGPVPGTGAA